MKKSIALVILSLLIGGCGTINYIPQEYVIAQERIANFDLNGDLEISGNQTDDTKQLFYRHTADWVGDYKSVTEHLVRQLKKEVGSHANKTGTGKTKTIQIKVNKLEAKQLPFHFTSTMTASVLLGSGEVVEINVSQGSPGNMWRVLNGTIALGVMDILKNPKVKQYLAE